MVLPPSLTALAALAVCAVPLAADARPAASGFVAVGDQALAAVSAAPARAFVAAPLAAVTTLDPARTTWEQMDVWWSEDGTDLLAANLPVPVLPAGFSPAPR